MVNSHQVWKDNTILKRRSDPYQIQRILIHGNLCRQTRCVIRAQKCTPVRIYANAKVSYSNLQLRLSNEVRYRCCDAGVDLGGGEVRRV